MSPLLPDVLKSLINHPLTDKGLDAFLADWQNHANHRLMGKADKRGTQDARICCATGTACCTTNCVLSAHTVNAYVKDVEGFLAFLEAISAHPASG